MNPECQPQQHSTTGGPVTSEIALRIEELRKSVVSYLDSLNLPNGDKDGTRLRKDQVRRLHVDHRHEAASRQRDLYRRKRDSLLEHFADGTDLDPARISPEIVEIQPDSEDGDLFRIATLLWSVPVSRGYGRRMRFVVKDRQNGKLIGLLALGSPVFNLRARDNWVGWTTDDRRHRLTSVMDAYVLGAVPPYDQLIGGKLVAALVTSQEIGALFANRYRGQMGIISGERRDPELALVTTTSALGRSSLYNRLTIKGKFSFVRLGQTGGYGHFHIPDGLFNEMRKLLETLGHEYANGHQFGSGPNWRMRVVREGLKALDLDQDLLRHGIQREVHAVPIATNWREYLCRRTDTVAFQRVSVADIGEACKTRWMVPRADRRPDFRNWSRGDTQALIEEHLL